MSIDPNRYHWRALILIARSKGIKLRTIYEHTGIPQPLLSAYSAHPFSVTRKHPTEGNAKILAAFFNEHLPAHIVRACTKYDLDEAA